MTTPNKNMVIEALVERFADRGYETTRLEEELIRVSCENIYQSGYLQGRYEALESMLKEFKSEEVSHVVQWKEKVVACGYCGGNTHIAEKCPYEKKEKY